MAHSKNQVLKDKMDNVTRYQPVIANVLANMKINRSEREDMAQECYVALLESQESWADKADDLALIAAICRRRIVRILESRAPSLGNGMNAKIVSADVPNIRHQLEKIPEIDSGEISESELHAAIGLLPEDDRQVIRARFIEGLTQQQTCGKLNLTVGEFKWRQKRGIDALKRFFEVGDASI